MPSPQARPRRTSLSSLSSANTLVEEEERPIQIPRPRVTHKRTKTSENMARFGKRLSWHGVDQSTLAKAFSSFAC
ncbi:hypothetical protein RRF57_007314 [Xylaria bambusicola]|uniref:Uncharacterized protein n=1 Tax=Xylaria bambusicola TaxID=326684 RepID=A0AAN7UFZ8_9PEZI